MKTIEQLKTECSKALNCLYIAVDESVAADVNSKVKAYIEVLEAAIAAKNTAFIRKETVGTAQPEIVENPEWCWKCKIRPQLNPTVGLCAECNGLAPAEPANAEFRNAASGAPGLDGGVQ